MKRLMAYHKSTYPLHRGMVGGRGQVDQPGHLEFDDFRVPLKQSSTDSEMESLDSWGALWKQQQIIIIIIWLWL